MREQRIVALVNVGGKSLLTRFGFEFDAISIQDLNTGPDLTVYDLFINDSVSLTYQGLSSKGRKALLDFFDAGGDYVGLGSGGSDLAKELGFMDFTEYNPPGNSIARVDLTAGDPVSAGFGEEGYVFVNSTALFSGLSDGVDVAASLGRRRLFRVGLLARLGRRAEPTARLSPSTRPSASRT